MIKAKNYSIFIYNFYFIYIYTVIAPIKKTKAHNYAGSFFSFVRLCVLYFCVFSFFLLWVAFFSFVFNIKKPPRYEVIFNNILSYLIYN